MRSFSQRLRQSSTAKTDNTVGALPAKVEIRQRLLNAIRPENAAVFDAYGGEGQLHRIVWSQANHYAGCDLKWYRDDRLMFVADNRRVMRVLDLRRFNIFDFDSWGSPWEMVVILCARRPVAAGERIGIALTEGTSLKARMGALPFALAHLAGFAPTTAGVSRSLDMVIDRAIAEMARRLKCRLVHRWQAYGKSGAKMRYIGVVLEGLAD